MSAHRSRRRKPRPARRGPADGAPGGWARRLEGCFPFVLVAVSLLVFAGSLSAGFTHDDHNFVLADPAIRSWHFWDLWLEWSRATVCRLRDGW